jgi:hypothetical protein
MSRFGYLLFTLLFFGAIYGLLVLADKMAYLDFVIFFIAAPFGLVNLFLVFFGFARWFMHENPDISREAFTFFYATCLVSVGSYAAFRFLPHLHTMHMLQCLR